MIDKTTIRAELKTRLKDLGPKDRELAASHVLRTLTIWLKTCDLHTLVAFMPGPDEIPMAPLFQEWIDRGKRLGLVRMEAGGALSVRSWSGADSELETGVLGVRQPHAHVPLLPLGSEQPGSERILVLVPGLGFGPDGARIGRGKGYYDRFLRSLEKMGDSFALTLGVGFHVQYHEGIPMEDHDQRLHGWILGARGYSMVYLDALMMRGIQWDK